MLFRNRDQGPGLEGEEHSLPKGTLTNLFVFFLSLLYCLFDSVEVIVLVTVHPLTRYCWAQNTPECRGASRKSPIRCLRWNLVTSISQFSTSLLHRSSWTLEGVTQMSSYSLTPVGYPTLLPSASHLSVAQRKSFYHKIQPRGKMRNGKTLD